LHRPIGTAALTMHVDHFGSASPVEKQLGACLLIIISS
jgi:hypothetical protein